MKITRSSLKRTFSFSWRDLLVSAAILLCATGACALLHQTADTIDGFASPVYVLAVLLILPLHQRISLRADCGGAGCHRRQLCVYISLYGV